MSRLVFEFGDDHDSTPEDELSCAVEDAISLLSLLHRSLPEDLAEKTNLHRQELASGLEMVGAYLDSIGRAIRDTC